MNVNQIFMTIVIVFVLISGSIGYWIYDLYESIEIAVNQAKAKNTKLQQYKEKVAKVTQLEDKKSKLEVRRNEVSVAVPLEGSQSVIDIMTIIDDLKNHVETDEVPFPLLITEHGVVSGVDVVEVKKGRGSSRSRTKTEKDYKTIMIRLSVHTTWLGLLRFVDLLEENEQIFNVTSITGTKVKNEKTSKSEGDINDISPLKFPFYSNANLTIETYHFRKEDKKKVGR